MSQLRIKGLVKIMNDVRQRLAAGIPTSEADQFREFVTSTVQHVERLCRENHSAPNQLPAPSFRAYQFLKTVDLQDLPLSDGEPAPPSGNLRIKNLLSICNQLQVQLDRLTREMVLHPASSKSRERKKILLKSRSQAATVEALCTAAGASPSALPLRSRRAYQWLKFLSDPDTLELHLTTLTSAHGILQEIRHLKLGAPSPEKDFRIELFPTSYLYRIPPKNQSNHFVIHEGFVGAPEDVIRALVRLAVSGRSNTANRIVKEYASSEDFAEMAQAVECIGCETDNLPQGRQYNLEVVFGGINSAYFGGELARPQLTWNQTLSRYKFGHYQPASDTVMISITLDDPKIPRYVIDFVMYHELLHKALGVQIKNGRRYAHTKEYRARERAFRRYAEAQAYLDQLAKVG